MEKVKCITSYLIPKYNLEESRVKSKLKLGIPLTKIDYDVIAYDVKGLRDSGLNDEQISYLFDIKYPNVSLEVINNHINSDN